MNTREIEEIVKNRGFERGMVYIAQALNEQVNQMAKAISELEKACHLLADTQLNLTQGVGGVQAQLVETLRKAGISVEGQSEDDLGPSTQGIQ